MNPEELARLYHKTLHGGVAQEFNLDIRPILWEDLSENTRSAMTAVAKVILDNIQTPLVGTADKPLVTVTAPYIEDTELNSIMLVENVLKHHTTSERLRILSFIRERTYDMHKNDYLTSETDLAAVPASEIYE